jgi:DNA-binding Lrp family transcriptional regulator
MKLTHVEHRILGALMSLAVGGIFRGSFRAISIEAECSISSVRLAVRRLQDSGYIERIEAASGRRPATWRVWG